MKRPHLGEQIGLLSRTTQRLLERRLVRSTSCSFLQLRALKAIQQEGIVTQVELGDRLMIDASAVSRLVDRLVSEELLERRAGEDRRCVRLAVTRKGLAEIGNLHAGLEWLDAEARQHLTDGEAETLRALLEKLTAGLRQAAPSPGE